MEVKNKHFWMGFTAGVLVILVLLFFIFFLSVNSICKSDLAISLIALILIIGIFILHYQKNGMTENFSIALLAVILIATYGIVNYDFDKCKIDQHVNFFPRGSHEPMDSERSFERNR